MSEEDLKNIEQVKEILKIRKEQKEIIETAGGTCINCDPDIKGLEGVLNLIEKQQKEIEEKTEQVKMLDEAYSGAIKESKKWFDIAKNSVPKEAIREKIKELSQDIDADNNIRIYTLKDSYEFQINILKELLGG